MKNNVVVNYIFNIGSADISCLGSAAGNLTEKVEEVAPAELKVWLVLLVGLVAFAIPFVLRLKRQKFPEIDKKFKDLEKKYKGKTTTENLLNEIDKVYTDEKISEKLTDGGVYRRKADLLERLTSHKRTKEFYLLIGSAAFASLLAAFLEGKLFGIEIEKLNIVFQNILACGFVGALGLIASALFNTVMYDFEDERCQIRKYELELINKLIDRQAESKLSASAVAENRDE